MLTTEATKKSGSGGHKWLVISALVASCALVCLALWESSPTVGRSEDAQSFVSVTPRGLLSNVANVDWQLFLECGRGGEMVYQVDNTRLFDLRRVVSVYFEPTFGGPSMITQYAVQTRRCNYAVRALNKGKEMSFVTYADGSFRAQVTPRIANLHWYGSTAAKDHLWNTCKGNAGGTRPVTRVVYQACGNRDGLRINRAACEFDAFNSKTRGIKVWIALAHNTSSICPL